MLSKARKNRQVYATMANQESSRSHSLIAIYLHRTEEQRHCRLIVADLAGSERHQATQSLGKRTLLRFPSPRLILIKKIKGERIREAGDINKSLSTLQNCISIIRNNQKFHRRDHIPFRNSKLTQLLAPDLCGQGGLTLIVNVNPNPVAFDEMTHVLEFSAVVSEVQIMRPRIDTGLGSGTESGGEGA